MSMIRCIYYDKPPPFPATDQHPDAERYKVGSVWVDAVGGEPTPQEIDAVLNMPAPKSEIDVLKDRIAALEAKVKP